jgi:NH3-dependent NAD+ synthetase
MCSSVAALTRWRQRYSPNLRSGCCATMATTPASLLSALPHGEQADERDAQKALRVINPDRTIIVNIKQASDAAVEALHRGGVDLADAARADFLLGNIKARQRMITQFAIASTMRGLVIGADHAAEALMGPSQSSAMALPTFCL